MQDYKHVFLAGVNFIFQVRLLNIAYLNGFMFIYFIYKIITTVKIQNTKLNQLGLQINSVLQTR
jgi:hypothetical protein